MRSLDSVLFQNRDSSGLVDIGNDRDGRDVDVTTVEGRIALGGKSLELGLIIPYRIVDDINGTTPDRNEISDVRTYIKLVPLRTEWFDAGAGFDLSWESGDEDESFGTGEIGQLPFATGTAHLGPVDVGAHIGYRFFNHSSQPDVAESLVYGGHLHAPVIESLAARVEIVGQTFDVPGSDVKALSVQPGFDFLVPLGRVDLILRPSGSFGLTDDTSDWGVGGSIALQRRWKAKSE
jgi:hypothetical protein